MKRRTKSITAIKKLQVRLRIWRKPQEPKLEYFHQGSWVPASRISEAREFALANGYQGIHITPI